jgi:hypothetical protein
LCVRAEDEMQKCVTALALVAIASAPALALGDEFRSGDRVEAPAGFFMCGARDDLATLQVLDRQGDRQTALKIGMERCEAGRPGYKYIVMQAEGDAVCIRRESAPYCLWARSSSIQVTPSQ